MPYIRKNKYYEVYYNGEYLGLIDKNYKVLEVPEWYDERLRNTLQYVLDQGSNLDKLTIIPQGKHKKVDELSHVS